MIQLKEFNKTFLGNYHDKKIHIGLFVDSKWMSKILRRKMLGCGKTTFVPKLAINNPFGALKKVEWIYAIELDQTREAEIESCFEAFVDFS